MLMFEVTAPHFRGRFILNHGVVVAGQQPLNFMAGWSLWQAIDRCAEHGWIIEQIHDGFPPPPPASPKAPTAETQEAIEPVKPSRLPEANYE